MYLYILMLFFFFFFVYNNDLGDLREVEESYSMHGGVPKKDAREAGRRRVRSLLMGCLKPPCDRSPVVMQLRMELAKRHVVRNGPVVLRAVSDGGRDCKIHN